MYSILPDFVQYSGLNFPLKFLKVWKTNWVYSSIWLSWWTGMIAKLQSSRLLAVARRRVPAHLSPYDWPLVNNWLPTIEIWGDRQKKSDMGFLPPHTLHLYRRTIPETFTAVILDFFHSLFRCTPSLFHPSYKRGVKSLMLTTLL